MVTTYVGKEHSIVLIISQIEPDNQSNWGSSFENEWTRVRWPYPSEYRYAQNQEHLNKEVLCLLQYMSKWWEDTWQYIPWSTTNIISVKMFLKNPHSLKSHTQSETNILQYPKIFSFLVILSGLTGNRLQPCVTDLRDRTIDLNQLNLWASVKMLRLILKIFSLQKQERKMICCLFGHF